MFRFERKGMGSIPIEITVNSWILRDPFLFYKDFHYQFDQVKNSPYLCGVERQMIFEMLVNIVAGVA